MNTRVMCLGMGVCLTVVLMACAPPVPPAPVVAPLPLRVGGDRDAHGCIGSAGYHWCAHEQTCVRPWELASARGLDNTPAAIRAYCEAASAVGQPSAQP
jgi:hypothetical protein